MLKAFFEGRWMPIQSRLGARAAAIFCAIAVDWCIRNIGTSAGADFIVLDQGSRTHVTPVAVAFSAILTCGAGWVILAVLERLVPYAKTIWTVGALAFLALSALPIAASQGTAVTKAFLAAINVATVVVVVPVMRRTARPRPLWSRKPTEVDAGVASSAVSSTSVPA